MDLMDLAQGYLEAEGFGVTVRGRDLILGTRRTFGEEVEFTYVWVPRIGDPQAFRTREGPYLAKFKEANDIHPHAPKFLLVPTMEGLSAEFRTGSRQWFNVKIRVPAQFFDTTFGWEDVPGRSSAVKDLRDRGHKALESRIAQPFSTESDGEGGSDLLEALFSTLRSADLPAKPIHFVVGPAGIGKTFFFEALFARLYDAFARDKIAQRLTPRPVPLLPEYIHLSDARTVRAILRAYLREDFVRPLESKVFEWMMTHGLAIWLLDGLDEIIAQDPSFFEYLLDLVTVPGASAPPSVVVCVRDSLLATNEDLRAFCDDLEDMIRVYRLGKWEHASRVQFAHKFLAGGADEFVGWVRANPALDTLTSTPYYCHLIAEQFRAGNTAGLDTEAGVLRRALDSILDREYDKGILQSAIVRKSDVLEFAEALAAEDLEAGFGGVPVSEARELAELILPLDVPQDTVRFVTQMTQLALFSYGGVGTIRFSQEILEHYLLGLHLIRALDRNPESLRLSLTKGVIPPDWITLRVIAAHVRETSQFAKLTELLYQGIDNSVGFRNMLQVAALSSDGPGALRDVPFERRDLSGVVFERLDLRSVSFRGCNLSDVTFKNCDLTSADLADAIMKNTAFLMADGGSLRGANIEGLVRFHSMRVEKGRVISTPGEARKWFEEKTGKRAPIIEPCAAAQQLRLLFGKFVRPDGSPRRSWLDRKGLLSGKRVHDPGEVLEGAVGYGYLVKDKRLDRFFRPEGDLYSEFVGYVTKLAVSPGLRALLGEVCPLTGCSHVPGV